MIDRLQCNKCGEMVTRNDLLLVGCLCDPDAPTWVAIQPDGRLIKMSHANITIFEQS